MGNAWVKLVTKTFNDNKKKAGYSFKQAIKDAKKVYKKGKTAKHLVEKPAHKGTQKADRRSRKHQGSDNHRRSRNHRG